MKLSPEAEEVATFFAKMLDHEYTTKDIFRKNFFKDWRKVGKTLLHLFFFFFLMSKITNVKFQSTESSEVVVQIFWFLSAPCFADAGNDLRGKGKAHRPEEVRLHGDERVLQGAV